MSKVVSQDPEVLGGEPVFIGTRVPVKSLFDHLEAGDSIGDFLDGFPSVKRELVIAVNLSPRQFRQWYYDRLEPWVNFVPVRADMSDLLERIADLRRDDGRARAIGQAGYELAASLDFASQVETSKPVIAAAFGADADAGGLAPELAKV